MKNYKNADSLVGIIIGVFILSVALMGIINVLGFSQNTLSIYNNSIIKYIIESNLENVTKKLDNTDINNGETFYLYKDTVNKEFKYLTGTANEEYKYINKFGEKIDPTLNLGKTYTTELNKKIDILRHVIYPPEIDNLVFHFDGQSVDGSNNSTLTDGEEIALWKDLSGNSINAYQNTSSRKPVISKYAINGLGGVKFQGTSNTDGDILLIDKDALLNNDDDCSNQFTFMEKSYAIVLKTGFDISRDQFIYEQGGQATGYSFSIHSGNLRAGILNKADTAHYSCFDDASQERDTGHKFKSVKLSSVTPDTTYFISIVQDSTHETSPGVEDDVNNRLKIYLNGELVSETDHVDPQPEHWKAGLGGVNERSVRPWNTDTVKDGDGQGGCDDQCVFFDGFIGEFVSWNHALTNNEIRGVQNYFKEKWLGAKSNIKYNRVESIVKKQN